MTATTKISLAVVTALAIVGSRGSVASAAATAVTKNQDFSFGKFVAGAGTVTVTTSGTRSSSGSVVLINGGTVTPARFTLTGTSGRNYTLTVPASLTLVSGTYQLTLSGVTPSIATTGVIPAGGSLSFTVGGTLNVNAAQHNGIYTGNLTLTVR
jgi:hypothetical protein